MEATITAQSENGGKGINTIQLLFEFTDHRDKLTQLIKERTWKNRFATRIITIGQLKHLSDQCIKYAIGVRTHVQ